jgi:hypothetical protein
MKLTKTGKIPTKKSGVKGVPHYLADIEDFYIQKFYDRCELQSNGCIYLKGNVQNTGYINWWYRHAETKRVRYVLAHRFAAIICGKFDADRINEYCVLHDCDRNYEPNDITYRQCVNPDHLWLGTVQENILDCIAKGRYVKPPRMIGEDNYNATLTEKQAKFIIENHYVIPQWRLAEICNVNRSTVESIHRNLTWKHLPR